MLIFFKSVNKIFMIKILRLTHYFPSENDVGRGSFTGFYYLYKNLIKQGAEVHVLTSGYPFQKKYENIDGIHVHRIFAPGTNFLRNKLFSYNLSILHNIPVLIKEKKIDIIHGHGFDPFLYVLFRKITGCKLPFIVTSHHTMKGWIADIRNEVEGPHLSSIQTWIDHKEIIQLENICFKNSDLILSVSKAHKEEISTNYNIPQEKISPVYNGVDTTIFNPNITGDIIREKYEIDESPLVLYVGGLGIRKGTKYLLEAAKLICKEVPDAKFLFVGSSGFAGDYFSKLSERLGLTSNVIFAGNVPFKNLPEYYAACDVFAFPTLHDCFGKVLVEAMACAKPTVGSNVCGIPEIIDDGNTGYLVRPKDAGDLKDKILRLIKDPDLASRMGIMGRKRVENMFTWEKAASENIKIYNKILSGELQNK